MRIRLEFRLPEPLVLPVNYQYMLQSAVYHLIRDEETIGKNLHDEGSLYEKRQYRLFTFGRMEGTFRIREGKIIFFDRVSLEIRSIHDNLIEALEKKVDTEGMRLGKRVLMPYRIYTQDRPIKGRKIRIRMDSPVVAYRTLEDKKTVFYSPWEDEFYELILDNMRRKYEAYSGEAVPREKLPNLIPYTVEEKDKVVTRYKDFYVTGWKGIYELEGEEKYLDFLYQTGLGAKNAQGFGMFQLVEMREERTEFLV